MRYGLQTRKQTGSRGGLCISKLLHIPWDKRCLKGGDGPGVLKGQIQANMVELLYLLRPRI